MNKLFSLVPDFATVVGYLVVSRPFLDLSHPRHLNSSHAELLEVKLHSWQCFISRQNLIFILNNEGWGLIISILMCSLAGLLPERPYAAPYVTSVGQNRACRQRNDTSVRVKVHTSPSAYLIKLFDCLPFN